MNCRQFILCAVTLISVFSSANAANSVLQLGGTAASFYPVFFKDNDWSNGSFELSVHRPDIHTDGVGFGSLLVEIRSHSSSWGHGSDFLESNVRWGGNDTLIAGVVRTHYSSGVVMWLRGARTYYYSSNHAVSVVENAAIATELVLFEYPLYGVREAYQARSAVDPALELNGRRFDNNVQVGGILVVAGNVGIGTTTPSHKLAVNGSIRAKEVIVDTGWSDYVFDPDYELAPLSAVEAHIKEHQHLPGIPSAAEVAESGISLGEMQAKLLAKIEEITLHQIEQAKEIARLKVINDSLLSRLNAIANAKQQ